MMKRDIINENCIIYNDDCFGVMEQLKQDKIEFDLILTDPPYGTIKGVKHIKNTDWDIKLDTRRMFRSIADVIRTKGRLILFSQEPYTSELRTTILGDLYFTQSAIWLKNTFGNPLGAKKNLLNVYEDLSLFSKKCDTHQTNPLRKYSKQILEFINLSYKDVGKILGHRKAEHFFYYKGIQFELCSEKVYNELINVFNIDKMEEFLSYDEMKKIHSECAGVSTFNLNGANSKKNVFTFSKEVEKYHTAQKPVEMLKELILIYTNENDLVLDFTMGSGSTGVACLLTNRKFIGIELNKEFYEIAKRRLMEVK